MSNIKNLLLLLVVSTVVLILSSCSAERRLARIIDKHPEALKAIDIDINDTTRNANVSIVADTSSFLLSNDSIKNDSLINLVNNLSFERDSALLSLFQVKELDSVQIRELRDKIIDLNNNHSESTTNIITQVLGDVYKDTCFIDEFNIIILIDNTDHVLTFRQRLCLKDGKIFTTPLETLYTLEYEYKDIDIKVDSGKKITLIRWIRDPKSISLLIVLIILILLTWRTYRR